MTIQRAAPFETNLLGDAAKADISNLFPATRRTSEDDMKAILYPTSMAEFLEDELSISKLDEIMPWLYLAGRPMPPRHLGYQAVLRREIVLVEKMDLHLVWKNKRIFIKPLPKYLLIDEIWTEFLSKSPGGALSDQLAACARGFVLSYCALISFESDFTLAQQVGLIPKEIEWSKWRTWTREVLQSYPPGKSRAIARRFWCGELRLGRLNKIYRFRKGYWIRGYTRIDSASTTAELLQENFFALASILSYVVIVLTAMQTGLSTDYLKASEAFQGASWGFTVFSIISPLAALMFIAGLFALYFTVNWNATKAYEKNRFEHMNVEPPSNEIPSTPLSGDV